MRYYVQFIAGLGDLVKRCLDVDLRGVQIVFDDESCAILESESTPRQVAALSYVKNAFVVLAATRRAALAAAVPRLISQLDQPEVAGMGPTSRGFRIMASLDGELVALPAGVRSRVEDAIASRTGGWVHARGSGEEFWIIGRRDLDMLLLGRRLPRQKRTTARRGALGQELSQMLVLASEPQSTDVFLDPCAGSGSIVVARLGFPARRIVYADSEYHRLRTELLPELARAARVDFLDEDARVLPSVSDGSIDVVVTDPPWGEYRDLDSPFSAFASGLSASLHRVLHPHTGRFVMLIARRATQVMADALNGAGLTVGRRYEVLVNGHPATVLVGGRVRGCPVPSRDDEPLGDDVNDRAPPASRRHHQER